jgi:hypothetical protein
VLACADREHWNLIDKPIARGKKEVFIDLEDLQMTVVLSNSSSAKDVG